MRDLYTKNFPRSCFGSLSGYKGHAYPGQQRRDFNPLMHGKISPSMYTGSMVGAGAMAFALMPYAIANARPDEGCTVDLNPKVLATIFGEPIKKVKEAIDYLCSPDKDSRSPECDGKRLDLVGPGPYRYRVVNLEKYRADANSEERNEYWKQYRRWERDGRKGVFKFTVNNVNGSEQFNSVQSTDADADADADTSPSTNITDPVIEKYTDSRVILHFLNEATGRHFREVGDNLPLISARLSEPEVTVDGVKQMILRQCKLWKGLSQEEYLRPATLFAKTKFDCYYAAKDQPINTNSEPRPKSLLEKLSDSQGRAVENLVEGIKTWK